MTRIFIYLIVFLPLLAAAQFTPDFSAKLKTAVEKKINGLRAEKKLTALLSDDILAQAATYHSIYQRDNDTLTHEEKTPGYFTPTARVRKFGGNDFEIVGENALYLYISESRLNAAVIDSLADAIALQWKNSPPHYANITNKKYVFGSLGFGYNSQTGKLYATQVFGKKGARVRGQLSTNAFGITKSEKDCMDQFGNYTNLVYNLGNDLAVYDHQVVLHLSDKKLINRMWNSAADGIAVDLVRRDQLPCGAANRFDFSPVYDGIMLGPMYKPEVLENNYAESDYRYSGVIARIPDNLNPKDYELSIILIDEGKACTYMYPIVIPRGNLEPVPVQLEIDDQKNAVMTHKGVIESRLVSFDFNTNDSIPVKRPVIPQLDYAVSSVSIQTFASIDGDSANNVRLQQARARYIRSYLSPKLNVAEEKYRIDARENWELMKFQLRYYGLGALAEKNNFAIRSEYLDWELPTKEMFREQRRATASIQYEGVLPKDAPIEKVAELNLRTGLLYKNEPMVIRALALLYHQRRLPDFVFTEPYFDLLKGNAAYVQNFSALLTLNTVLYRVEIAKCLDEWVGMKATIPEAGRRNLLYLYSLANSDILRIWDLPAEHLKNILEPRRLYPLKEKTPITDQALLFDLHLTFISYYGQINDSKEIDKSFDFIIDYIDRNNLPLEKHKELALFSNKWSMYGLTIKRLKACMEKNLYDAESIMILLQTASFYRTNFDEASYKKVIELAKKIAPADFCKWVNGNFQVMRNDDLKAAYCQICNKR